MSFTGDLEHLSIVDVIQLLHATRKSGTLRVSGPKGESQLVFKDGYILSANHVDNHVRIGNILVERKVITEDQLHLALLDQNSAGPNRRPLIAMLIEQGVIDRDEAYRCLEMLIELTIVEIIGWKKGSFTLDVGECSVDDEYRYFPEKFHEEIYLHTENVLMDALRIYDERMRDRLASGLGAEDTEQELEIEVEIEPWEGEASAPRSPAAQVITADDLGLADMDSLKPARKERFVPLSDHRRMMRTRHHAAESDLPDAIRQEISDFVDSFPSVSRRLPPSLSVAILSKDEFLSMCLTVACKQSGICLLVLSDLDDLLAVLQQSFLKRSTPIVIFDASSFPGEEQEIRSALISRYPTLELIEIVQPDPTLLLGSVAGGARTVLPAPSLVERPETFTQEYKRLISELPSVIASRALRHDRRMAADMRDALLRMKGAASFHELLTQLLLSMGSHLPRVLVLIPRDGMLYADRSMGVREPLGEPSPPLGFTLPLTPGSPATTLLSAGGVFYGPCRDVSFIDQLHRQIFPPVDPVVLLMPVRGMSTSFALLYADHGTSPPGEMPIELLETMSMHAGILLEHALMRSRLQKK